MDSLKLALGFLAVIGLVLPASAQMYQGDDNQSMMDNRSMMDENQTMQNMTQEQMMGMQTLMEQMRQRYDSMNQLMIEQMTDMQRMQQLMGNESAQNQTEDGIGDFLDELLPGGQDNQSDNQSMDNTT